MLRDAKRFERWTFGTAQLPTDVYLFFIFFCYSVTRKRLSLSRNSFFPLEQVAFYVLGAAGLDDPEVRNDTQVILLILCCYEMLCFAYASALFFFFFFNAQFNCAHLL